MPRFSFPHNLEPPAPPDVPELAVFDVAVVPYALAALESRATQYTWSESGYVRGVQLIRRLQLALLQGGLAELLESNRQIYRLLDTALYGRTYEQVSTEPLVIVPEIPPVPDTFAAEPGIVPALDGLAGVLDAGWFGIGGHKATLADIVAALRVGNSQSAQSIASKLQGILTGASSAANIGQLITDMFTGAVQATEEGGIMVLLAASIVGNLAATSALSVQLQTMQLQLARISNSLDGGGFPPDDNVLEALRGAVPAGAERNVIDAASQAITRQKLDEMIAELEAIRVQLQ